MTAKIKQALDQLEKEAKNLPPFNRAHYKFAIEDIRTALAKIDLIDYEQKTTTMQRNSNRE